jgi:hypothetical protein
MALLPAGKGEGSLIPMNGLKFMQQFLVNEKW